MARKSIIRQAVKRVEPAHCVACDARRIADPASAPRHVLVAFMAGAYARGIALCAEHEVLARDVEEDVAHCPDDRCVHNGGTHPHVGLV